MQVNSEADPENMAASSGVKKPCALPPAPAPSLDPSLSHHRMHAAPGRVGPGANQLRRGSTPEELTDVEFADHCMSPSWTPNPSLKGDTSTWPYYSPPTLCKSCMDFSRSHKSPRSPLPWSVSIAWNISPRSPWLIPAHSSDRILRKDFPPPLLCNTHLAYNLLNAFVPHIHTLH